MAGTAGPAQSHGVSRVKPSASCWRLIKVARFLGSGLPLSRTLGETDLRRLRSRPARAASGRGPSCNPRSSRPTSGCTASQQSGDRGGAGGSGHQLLARTARRRASSTGAAGRSWWGVAGPVGLVHLNTPNFSFMLPGLTYDGPEPDAFLPRCRHRPSRTATIKAGQKLRAVGA